MWIEKMKGDSLVDGMSIVLYVDGSEDDLGTMKVFIYLS